MFAWNFKKSEDAIVKYWACLNAARSNLVGINVLTMSFMVASLIPVCIELHIQPSLAARDHLATVPHIVVPFHLNSASPAIGIHILLDAENVLQLIRERILHKDCSLPWRLEPLRRIMSTKPDTKTSCACLVHIKVACSCVAFKARIRSTDNDATWHGSGAHVLACFGDVVFFARLSVMRLTVDVTAVQAFRSRVQLQYCAVQSV